MSNPIQPLKGFRDFLSPEALKRQWLKTKLESIFRAWGYDPLETPTLEPLELFQGQIGEDEKLFYQFTDNGGRQVALRYDQTVPTCRIVGSNWQSLPTPFRRYQIQPAFRAENPQKGRYREFLQADADIFGTDSPVADAEVIALSLDIYRQLGFKNPLVLVNDRTLLKTVPYPAIAAIDKLEKIGRDQVLAEMVAKGILPAQAEIYLNYVQNLQPNAAITAIFDLLKQYGFPPEWYRFEPTLARSFSYSSGPIWEVKIPEIGGGSVLGGERYDFLVEKISGQKIPGTGFGLGFDRTLEACQQLGLVPDYTASAQILVTIFSPELLNNSVVLSTQFRQVGLATELFPDPRIKLEKQLKYAAKKSLPYAAILGPEEAAQNTVVIKNLQTGNQETLPVSDLAKWQP